MLKFVFFLYMFLSSLSIKGVFLIFVGTWFPSEVRIMAYHISDISDVMARRARFRQISSRCFREFLACSRWSGPPCFKLVSSCRGFTVGMWQGTGSKPMFSWLYQANPCDTMLFSWLYHVIQYHAIPCYTILYHVIPCYTVIPTGLKRDHD